MVVDFVCGVLGLRPPERYERAVWVVLLIVLVIVRVGVDADTVTSMEHSPRSAARQALGWETTEIEVVGVARISRHEPVDHFGRRP